MKTKTEEMYASMNPWRLFFVVAMPGMISMFAMSVYSIFEGIFIGQTLGEGAFAAVNIAMPLVMINFSLSDLIGVGASVPISIALGQDDKETANNGFSCSVIMIFSFFLISEIPMFSMKFKNLSWKSNKTRYIFLLVSIPMLVLGYLAPLAIISWYLILSIVLSFRAQKA